MHLERLTQIRDLSTRKLLRIISGIATAWVVAYVLMFVIFPATFRMSSELQTRLLFFNILKTIPRPEAYGIHGARSFHITTDENVKIGAWQILPRSLVDTQVPSTAEAFEEQLKKSGRPIFLYLHGTGGNRAKRGVPLYLLLQSMDYHVVAFDYRGFGDSDANAKLSEIGIVTDSKYMLTWLMKIVDGSAPIFVWGHSLGTGVSCHMLALLAEDNIRPAGLILEAPFNSLADAAMEFPLLVAFRHVPWFRWAFVEPLSKNKLTFESERHIGRIICPVLILHAEDDRVVPIILGKKLYAAAKKLHCENPKLIKMIAIDSAMGLGHFRISQYKPLPDLLRSFVSSATVKEKKTNTSNSNK